MAAPRGSDQGAAFLPRPMTGSVYLDGQGDSGLTLPRSMA